MSTQNCGFSYYIVHYVGLCPLKYMPTMSFREYQFSIFQECQVNKNILGLG